MRAEMMCKALAYYDGHEPRDILKIKPDEPDDNLSVNYAQTIVDKGVSFLFGQELGIEIGGEGDESGEKLLSELWPVDIRCEDLIDLGTNGGTFGTAWIKLALDNGKPMVHVVDPLNMSAKWDAANYKLVREYCNQYNTQDAAGKPVIRRERAERQPNGFWKIFSEESKPDSMIWLEFAPTVNWNYPFAPFFHCKNLPKPNEFYGKADLNKSVLSLAYYIARVDSLINKIVRVHASPKPWARGMQKQDLQVGSDQMLFLPKAEMDLKLLEATGDLAGAQGFRKELRVALAEISHAPEVASGKVENIGQLSGLALKILYGPLIDRTAQKQRTYGRLITNVVKALLTLSGKPDQEVTLNWQNPLPQDPLADLQAQQIKKGLGVSEEQILTELGYDTETIKQMQAANQKAAKDAADMQRQVFDAGFGGE